MNLNLKEPENPGWSALSYEEKNTQLYLRQKETLDLFLARRAISEAQYSKSLRDLAGKMRLPASPEASGRDTQSSRG